MRWGPFILILLMAYLLQTALLSHAAPKCVDLLWAVALVCGLTAPAADARLAGWLTGFLQDVGTTGPLGLHALALGLAIMVLTHLRDAVNRELWWVRWLTAALVTLPAQLLIQVHFHYWQGAWGTWWTMLSQSLSTAVVTGLLAALIVGAPRLLHRRRRVPSLRW